MPRRFASAYRRRGSHDVGAFHEGDQAGGRVSGVADWRGREHDRSARNVDVGDQSVEPEFGTFRGLRGFLGIFRVLADFGNLTNICFHGLFHGVTSLLGISLFAQVLHISSIAHSVPKPSAPAISPSFATNQSKNRHILHNKKSKFRAMKRLRQTHKPAFDAAFHPHSKERESTAIAAPCLPERSQLRQIPNER